MALPEPTERRPTLPNFKTPVADLYSRWKKHQAGLKAEEPADLDQPSKPTRPFSGGIRRSWGFLLFAGVVAGVLILIPPSLSQPGIAARENEGVIISSKNPVTLDGDFRYPFNDQLLPTVVEVGPNPVRITVQIAVKAKNNQDPANGGFGFGNALEDPYSRRVIVEYYDNAWEVKYQRGGAGKGVSGNEFILDDGSNILAESAPAEATFNILLDQEGRKGTVKINGSETEKGFDLGESVYEPDFAKRSKTPGQRRIAAWAIARPKTETTVKSITVAPHK
ncbi:hypothetical protein HYS97_01645 [Candidatus Daviesbacteria bacterium]|nr:hypothetical protein [Candidatus Daviesbacteria bacterium]